jgi:muconolactone delta-isomerase
MQFLVELDHVKSGAQLTPEAARSFVEQVIFPTLARAEQLSKERKILAGGPVAGRIALRFIMEAESAGHVDQFVTSLPLWPLAETRVTPLISLGERHQHANISWKASGLACEEVLLAQAPGGLR